ncbi:MAG: ATP-dependent Clp protease proteolytic subunit [Gammaproteobacteria bacterium]|nr:ATP-dependent Clp protease proteolytic subunit [Gammaproteobacteria bacterium]
MTIKNKVINVRGVIVPSSMDASWAKDYIDKGQFTPESRVRAQIDAADKTMPLAIYVNSPGGSVYAGNEMINAINAWAADSGQPVEITVGAMAASMAAAMLVTTASKVTASKNTKIMFHGSWGVQIGGSEAMVDKSEELAKVNADIKAALITNTNLDPELINGWFEEGREGWLTADEALAAGVVDSVLDTEADVTKISKAAANVLTDRGSKLAALTAFVEEETVVVPPVVEGNKDVIALSKELEAAKASGAGWQAKHDKLKKETDAIALASAEEVKGLKSEVEVAKTETEALTSRVAKLSLQAAKLPQDGQGQVADWEAALKACDNDYAEAKKQYPALHQACFDEDNKK